LAHFRFIVFGASLPVASRLRLYAKFWTRLKMVISQGKIVRSHGMARTAAIGTKAALQVR
jgi:hypothetical protein